MARRPALADGADVLAAPVTVLPGIGPALAQALAERGLVTVEDLLWLVPRRWLDARTVTPLAALADAADGARVAVGAVVASARMVRVRGRRWGEVRCAAAGAPVRLVVRWFGMWGGVAERFPVGAEVALAGVVKRRGAELALANPDVLAVGVPGEPLAAAGRIVPRYPEVPGVPAGKLRTACAAAVALAGARVDDGVPAAVAERLSLPALGDALAALHAPSPDLTVDEVAALDAGTSPYHRRLAFAELFALAAVIARRRAARRADVAPALAPPAADVDGALARALPYPLTAAQRRALAELRADLAMTTPMSRLLQGDVGAGKTAVAFGAALTAVLAGAQVALMAPTELLAEQHHATWTAWGRPLGLAPVLLTSSTSRREREAVVAALATGAQPLVIGTHALLADDLGFARLGLVIVDEQHRFGVAQRALLRDKGAAGAPHLLVMTATPIPRTLALTVHGDLDVTVIDALPPGRTPPTTLVVRGARGLTTALARLRARLAAGERGFVVCPRIEAEPGERRARRGAREVHAELTAALAPARIGLCHGREPAAERAAVMAAFAAGALDVLVATTVVEVGVDVPAATVMLVLDADGFGLAQLHQLRGRVGRGGGPSWCLLATGAGASDDGLRRLEILATTVDGFVVAEEDLALRGPGELLGARQAGLPRLRFGDLHSHAELLLLARAEAEALLGADPDLTAPAHAGLARAVARREAAAATFGAESG